jgi:lipopolysaccharide biosynthesis glycosyltransferase
MQKNAIEIFFVATGDYAPFVTTTALSIIENTKEQVNFHLLTENFKLQDKIKIKDFLKPFENASIEFTDVDEKLKTLDDVPLIWFKSAIPYARLLIPELTTASKAIYMDIDIIVNCNIKELWDIDFTINEKEYALAAALDAQKPTEELSEHIKNNLKLSPNHQYFNNGLLVMNCDKWREEKIAQKLLKISRESKITFLYPTQDVFNIYFDNNNYVPFDNSYNSMPFYIKPNDEYNPKCLHYVMLKPCLNCTSLKSEVFWKYARKTPYYEQFLIWLINENIDDANRVVYNHITSKHIKQEIQELEAKVQSLEATVAKLKKLLFWDLFSMLSKKIKKSQ